MTVLADRQRGRLPARTEQSPAWVRYAVPAAVALAALHVGLVAGHYVVGSFDDDSHYLSLAKAFVHGHGYVDTSIPGSPVETLYPPGYPLLIAPLVWLFGSAVWPLRVLSAIAYLGCFPLLDRVLRRHPVPDGVRVATLMLFALNPTVATFGSEVMPETIFLLVLLAVLVALPRWEEEARVRRWPGVVVAVGAPYLLLLKTAGLPMLAGVLLWLLLRRRWRQLAVTVAVSSVMLLPLVLVRLASGPALAKRYTDEYELAGPLLQAIWHGARIYVTDAVPATLVPTIGAGLHGHLLLLDVLLWVVRFSAAAIVVLGWVSWVRRRVDVTLLIAPLYLAETVPFAFVNERRVILLLPVVAAWYALGWHEIVAWVRLRATEQRRRWLRHTALVPAVLLLPLLAWQLPRDYLLNRGESTPAARGSGYVAALRELTPRGWSIEAGYEWTIADLTGRTATNELHNTLLVCSPGARAEVGQVRDTLRRDHVATVLNAWVKWPKNMDNLCLLDAMSRAPWAVPAYHGTDASTVFVLLGRGTARPDLRVAVDAPRPSSRLQMLPSGTRVRELSVVAYDTIPVIELRTGPHQWVRVRTTTTTVEPRLVHAELPQAVSADAVRVTGGAEMHLADLVVLAENR